MHRYYFISTPQTPNGIGLFDMRGNAAVVGDETPLRTGMRDGIGDWLQSRLRRIVMHSMILFEREFVDDDPVFFAAVVGMILERRI